MVKVEVTISDIHIYYQKNHFIFHHLL